MSSKLAILEELKESSILGYAMPTIDIAPRLDNLIGQFETNLTSVAGVLHRDAGIEGLQQKVDELIAEGQQVISLIDGINGNREMPTDPHDLKDIDFAVIKGELAVAENGAVWVRQPEKGPRNAPFICENLLLLVDHNDVVANMHQAMKKMTLNPGEFGSYIAGPSKTADIEQALVVGAHGAFSLNVYLV